MRKLISVALATTAILIGLSAAKADEWVVTTRYVPSSSKAPEARDEFVPPSEDEGAPESSLLMNVSNEIRSAPAGAPASATLPTESLDSLLAYPTR